MMAAPGSRTACEGVGFPPDVGGRPPRRVRRARPPAGRRRWEARLSPNAPQEVSAPPFLPPARWPCSSSRSASPARAVAAPAPPGTGTDTDRAHADRDRDLASTACWSSSSARGQARSADGQARRADRQTRCPTVKHDALTLKTKDIWETTHYTKGYHPERHLRRSDMAYSTAGSRRRRATPRNTPRGAKRRTSSTPGTARDVERTDEDRRPAPRRDGLRGRRRARTSP